MSQTLLPCGPAAAGELDGISMTGNAFSKYLVRISIVLLILCAGLILLLRVPRLLTSRKVASTDDFVEYWSAGRLNLRGEDPYSPKELRRLQLRGTDRRQGVPVMMWNPPWALALVMPFGALDYSSSRSVWFFCQIALLIFCASFTWRFYGGRRDQRWLAWLVTLSFPPTLMLLRTGQISALMLAGAVLLLVWTERRAWWLASLSMLFIFIKPHILYLLPLAFLFWTVRERQWTLLGLSGLGVCLATATALFFNPAAIAQYHYAATHHPPTQWVTPTIGGMLRYFLGGDKVWLQFSPTALGTIWFCLYWSKHHRTWNWAEQIPPLIMVSVVTSSYGWAWDYVVMIPVILYVTVRLFQTGVNRVTLLTTSLYIAIQAVTLWPLLHAHYYKDAWFVWLAPSLAVWYFLFVRLQPASQPVGAG